MHCANFCKLTRKLCRQIFFQRRKTFLFLLSRRCESSLGFEKKVFLLTWWKAAAFRESRPPLSSVWENCQLFWLKMGANAGRLQYSCVGLGCSKRFPTAHCGQLSRGSPLEMLFLNWEILRTVVLTCDCRVDECRTGRSEEHRFTISCNSQADKRFMLSMFGWAWKKAQKSN